MEKIKIIKKINLKILYILFSICFAIPSIKYLLINKTILNFEQYFKYLLDDTYIIDQTLIYIVILSILTIIYLAIIKYRKQIFKNIKEILIFVSIIAMIFIIVLPFTSSDIFYYLGIGRIGSNYNQNPYYTTIKEFVEQDDNVNFLEKDTVLKQGDINYWSDTTVVYGPVWTMICQIVAFLSFGNIDIALLLFKILHVIIHVLNCYIIYKLSNKRIFVLIYGLSPFVLLEGIANVHNDIFIVFFVLMSIYFLIKQKKLLPSIIFLALATAIKYFTILLLPFMIIYHFKKEKPSKRLLKCILYGTIFIIIVLLLYLIYIQDVQVFNGIFTMQTRFAKNFYIIILEYFKEPQQLATIINKTLLYSFVIIYFFTYITVLNKKKISYREELQRYNYFLLAFLFLLITNFQPWYIMWLFPCIIWQKADMIKLIMQISLISEFGNSIFLAYSENWKNGVPFTFLMVTSILIAINLNLRNRQKLRKTNFRDVLQSSRGGS